jgi:hypothetical protein
VARGQHVDALRSELDRVGDRRVVGHAAVHEGAAFPRDWLEHTRDGGAGEDRIEYPAARKTKLLAGHHVHCDHAAGPASPQAPRIRRNARSGAADRTQGRGGRGHQGSRAGPSGVEREYLPATQLAPDPREALSGRGRLGARWDLGPVERARGGPHDHIRLDVALVERPQHPDLNRAPDNTKATVGCFLRVTICCAAVPAIPTPPRPAVFSRLRRWGDRRPRRDGSRASDGRCGARRRSRRSRAASSAGQ